MFEAEDTDGTVRYFDVPQDDYRSIRRAILDLSEFDRENPEFAASDGGLAQDSAEREVGDAG
jgi:hypothetical protein